MGDPRKIRKKYETPTHPWQKERIEEEKALSEEYGLNNKKEIWRMTTILKGFKNQVKSLASRTDKQSRLEEEQLVNKLCAYGLMTRDQPLADVLGLSVKSVLDRRLQTIIVKKGFARTVKQARQFITHGHVIVAEKKITFPSFLVSLADEPLVQFVATSTIAKEDHPEREIKEAPKKIGKKADVKKEEAPPTFSEDEIVQIEEKGAVKAEPKKSAETTGDTKDTKDVKEEKVEDTPKSEEPVKPEEPKETIEEKK